jgi:hypothetical protein
MPDYHKSSLSEARSYAATGDHLLAYDVATGAADDDTACTDHDATSLGLIIGRDGYWFLPRIVPLCLAPSHEAGIHHAVLAGFERGNKGGEAAGCSSA